MKLSSRARWLIILALIALLTVGSAGMAVAAGSRHLPRFRHIAPDNLSSVLRHKKHGYNNFGRHSDLLDKAAIETAAANALGVNPDELQSAVQAGRDSVQELLDAAGLELADLKDTVEAEVESQLAAAVEAGALTQEEMDAILRHDLGRMEFGRGRHGRFGKQILPTGAVDVQAVLQAAAANAGWNAEDLLAALTEGRSSLDTFLEANDTTPAEFKAALDTALQQAIDDAVEAGTLTEAQANRLDRTRGLWGGRHHGRHGPDWFRNFGSYSPLGNNA